MTTMAALLGALPLMLGTGTGSELRHPLGITIVGGLIVSQLLTLFTTPVIYLYFDRLARAWPPGAHRRPGRTGGAGRMNLSEPFIRRPVATTLLTIGHRARRRASPSSSCRSRRCRRSISRPSRSRRTMPGASPEAMAATRGHAARAPSRADRRRHRDDLAELRRLHAGSLCSSAWTATSTARRATSRRRSTPRAPTCRPRCAATRPTARSIRPTRPVMILALTSEHAHRRADLRRRRHHPAAEALAGERRRPGADRRQLAAGGARRAQPQRALQVRHRPRGRARRARRRQRQHAPRARSRTADSASRSTPTTRRARPPNTATW